MDTYGAASKQKGIHFEVCPGSPKTCPPEVRRPEGVARGPRKYPWPRPLSSSHESAATPLHGGWLHGSILSRPTRIHGDAASGWLLLSVTRDRTRGCLSQAVQLQEHPGRARGRAGGPRPRPLPPEFPTRVGQTPVGRARGAAPGLPRGLFLALRQWPPGDILITICLSPPRAREVPGGGERGMPEGRGVRGGSGGGRGRASSAP